MKYIAVISIVNKFHFSSCYSADYVVFVLTFYPCFTFTGDHFRKKKCHNFSTQLRDCCCFTPTHANTQRHPCWAATETREADREKPSERLITGLDKLQIELWTSILFGCTTCFLAAYNGSHRAVEFRWWFPKYFVLQFHVNCCLGLICQHMTVLEEKRV